MKTDFHNKDFALSLALKWRLRWTRKWPISSHLVWFLFFFPAALLEWPLGNIDFKTASSCIALPLQEQFPVFYDYIPSTFILVRDKKNLNCGSHIQVAKTGTQKLCISSKIQPLRMPLYWVYHLWYSTFLWKLIYSIYLISISANHMHQPKTGFSSPANFSMCQNLETKSKSTSFYILKVWC